MAPTMPAEDVPQTPHVTNAPSLHLHQVTLSDGTIIGNGVFDKASMDCFEANDNTVPTLRRLAEAAGVKIEHSTRLLVCGTSSRAYARKIARETGAVVTAIVTGEVDNHVPHKKAADGQPILNVTLVNAACDKLPSDWADTFDLIMSHDGFVQAEDKAAACREAFRVLKPGGFIVFTDIMASPVAADGDMEWLKRHLHTKELYSVSKYEQVLGQSGLQVLRTRDLTGNLKTGYRRLIEFVTSEQSRLERYSEEDLKNFTNVLRKNVEVLNDRDAQTWHAMLCSKPSNNSVSNGVAPKSSTGILKRYVSAKLHNVAVTDKSVYYHGSVSICTNLMKLCNIGNYESVDVVNLRNGARWITYAIPNDTPGAFTLNGGGARLGEIGDECVVMTFEMAEKLGPARVVYCDPEKNNDVIDQFTYTG